MSDSGIPKVRLHAARFFVRECQTHMPFRFGIVTLRSCPLALAEVDLSLDDGRRVHGFASDLLVPKWFEKNPDTSLEKDSLALLASAQLAAQTTAEISAGDFETVFELWRRLYQERVGLAAPDAPDRLVRGFGVALIERAIIDAACRGWDVSFFRALREDLFGFRPGRVLPELTGWRMVDDLASEPLESLAVRHTVGLGDPLTRSDLEDPESSSDHPQTLEEDIERYGLRWFKVKVNGDPERDLERLRRIAAILEEQRSGDYQLTLDGNEQYRSLGDLRSLLKRLANERLGSRLVERIAYIEQPLARTLSFDRQRLDRLLHALDDFGGVILDEADTGIDSFPSAIELGYRGVSVKNCKGVFRALLNRGLCRLHSRPNRVLFQSSEDLTNLPVFALQQDLATAAALGLEHSERNGHHYFRGLDHLPDAEVAQALELHPDLYQSDPYPRLRIADGRLRLTSIQGAGYGSQIDPDLDAWMPAESFANPRTEP